MDTTLTRTSAHHGALAYRAEIDGLRALSIISVLLFHVGIDAASGGFVGVDVFFVISGYLITAILVREIAAGEFSTLRFYERRVRRIFPALLTMFAACWIVAVALLMPFDLRAFARSMVASGIFSSNILFWAEGGYFDTAAELKPLLHTWSLSVEEQFYIVFPALLSVLLTKVRHWKMALGAVFVLSLALCARYTGTHPNAAFYLPQFRMWELLTGAFVALSIGFGEIRAVRIRTLMALLGVAGIGWGIFTFTQATSFPGLHALLPCVGAALVIAYSHHTIVGRVFAAKPLVWIGKLSYSLYLWHWPIIVFARYYRMRELDTADKLAVIALSVAAAYLSMRFIETPFRVRRLVADTASMCRTAAFAMVAFVSAGLATYVGNGLPQRFPQDVQKLAKGASDTNPARRLCDNRPAREVARGHVCLIGKPDARASFAVVGDSFGDALIPGIERAAIEAGGRGMILTSSGCYPLAGVIDVNKRGDATCSEFIAASLDLIRRTPSITDVILVGRWTSAALGTRFGASYGVDWFINDGASRERSYPENRRVFVRSLTRTVELLKGRNVHIVSNIPEQRIDPPRTLALCTYLGRDCPAGVSLAEYERRQAFVRSVIERLRDERGVGVIDVGSMLCSASGCKVVGGGDMLYSDDNHLSRAGALFIKDLFLPVFDVTHSLQDKPAHTGLAADGNG